jgi:hypothetical protein
MVTTNYSIGNLTSIPSSRSTYLSDYYTDNVYSFNITNTSSINLNLHNISAGDDADLRLYADSNHNGVFDSGDQQLQYSIHSGNSDDSINYLASAGTYFARVERYAPGSSGQLDYRLDLSATQQYPSPANTAPPNLLPTEFDGGVLSSGNTYTNNDWVGNTDTSDVYRFSVANYGNVTVRLTGLSSDADIRLIDDLNNNHIVDPGEVDSAFTSTHAGSSDETISWGRHSYNPFFIQVYQYSGDTSYQLQVNVSSWI